MVKQKEKKMIAEFFFVFQKGETKLTRTSVEEIRMFYETNLSTKETMTQFNLKKGTLRIFYFLLF